MVPVPALKRKQDEPRRPFITVIARRTLSLWFVFAGSIFIISCQIEILNQNNSYLSDFHRRDLKANVDSLPDRHLPSHPVKPTLRDPMGAQSKLIPVGLKDPAQKTKVLEKMRKRQESRAQQEQQDAEKGIALSKTFDFSQKNFSTYPILPSERVLPDMTTDKGGVIFFYHVPKTGGQTIRHNFGHKQLLTIIRGKVLADFDLNATNQDKSTMSDRELLTLPFLMSHLKFVMANDLDAFLGKAVPKINNYLSTRTNNYKILLVEVHGMDNFNTFELEPYLQAWRKRSQETQVPFFSFSVLREPLSEQVSFFNYYFLHPGDPRFCNDTITTSTRCRKRGQADNNIGGKQESDDYMIRSTIKWNAGIDLEDAMVKSIYSNPQCLFLARGERTFGSDAAHLRENLSGDECSAAYRSLQRTMDWVGRTDTLTTETLPLLTSMMFQKPAMGRSLIKTNVSPQKDGFVALSKVQPRIRQALEESTRYDQDIYQRVQLDYQMDQWVNFMKSK